MSSFGTSTAMYVRLPADAASSSLADVLLPPLLLLASGSHPSHTTDVDAGILLMAACSDDVCCRSLSCGRVWGSWLPFCAAEAAGTTSSGSLWLTTSTRLVGLLIPVAAAADGPADDVVSPLPRGLLVPLLLLDGIAKVGAGVCVGLCVAVCALAECQKRGQLFTRAAHLTKCRTAAWTRLGC